MTDVNGARRGSRAPYVFVAPAVLLFLAFLAAPIGYAVYLSARGLRLTGTGIFGTRQEVFVGLDNYARILTDAEFWAASAGSPSTG
ncbi:hypothetical protein ACFQ0B_58035 [Nonomuraea thailandensis]